MRCDLRLALAALLALLLGWTPCGAAPWAPEFAGFAVKDIDVAGVRLHVRIGGHGDAVLLLHGFAETGDMWAPLATALARSHTVVVPDLRGMGLSSRPEGGYDKKTQAQDIARLLDALGIPSAALVTHDIGNMVGYAFAAQFPARVSRFAIIDAPLPGIGPWDAIARRHGVWHWSFWGADAERLVAGRERIYLDRFWNEFTAPGNHYPDALRAHLAAQYALPGAMHAAFEQFKAFDQDAIDNRAFSARGKLAMPVLAVGGERSYGATMAAIMREVADDVTERVIPGSGHWVLEERPAELMAAVLAFLGDPGPFALSSPDVEPGGTLGPAQVRDRGGCSGQNQSPRLSWRDAPAGARSFAVTMFDRDAPTGSGWWHWVVFNIPAAAHELGAGAGDAAGLKLPAGAVQSRTDFGTPGFGGACPPGGAPAHRYVFTVHALDVDAIAATPDASAALVGYQIHLHELGRARLEATYGRAEIR